MLYYLAQTWPTFVRGFPALRGDMICVKNPEILTHKITSTSEESEYKPLLFSGRCRVA